MSTSEDRARALEERAEEAAAAEAASIGGPAPDYEGDEESRPLEEAGEGVAEGFEESERALVEAAGHGDQRHSPADDEFAGEVRADEATAEYGEPDEVDPTEVVRDPEADGDDDPGEGPGIAAER
ncbi:MAG TPA: hypothetical protein VK307_06820 [Thermoleophilaceae bacterium]|nr:hypothetical protein [Thermoleophilaceae bacterium]